MFERDPRAPTVAGTATQADGDTPPGSPSPDLDDEVIALARSLIQIDTTNPPGHELPAAMLVSERLADAGIAVEVQRFASGRANLVARLPGRGEQGALMLCGHLDTVPVDEPAWRLPAWGGVVEHGRLYGRGALDMKGAVAAMVIAMERVHEAGWVPAGDVVLALTAGEETDSVGARVLAESGLVDDVTMAVIGEPTDLTVGVAHRGALWVQVQAAGAAGHGAQPDAGTNAVRALLDWLNPIASIEALVDGGDVTYGAGGVSLNMIGGGSAPNVIPNQAHAVLDFRTVGGHDHSAILQELRERGEEVELTVLRDAPSIAIASDDPLVRAAVAAVTEVGLDARTRGMPYVTDGSVFVDRLGLRAIVIGPGSETGAHRDDESIALSELAAAAQIYQSLVQRLLGG